MPELRVARWPLQRLLRLLANCSSPAHAWACSSQAQCWRPSLETGRHEHACHTCLLSCSLQIAEPNSVAADELVLKTEPGQQMRAGYKLQAAPTCARLVLPWICLRGNGVPQAHLSGPKIAGAGRELMCNFSVSPDAKNETRIRVSGQSLVSERSSWPSSSPCSCNTRPVHTSRGISSLLRELTFISAQFRHCRRPAASEAPAMHQVGTQAWLVELRACSAQQAS